MYRAKKLIPVFGLILVAATLHSLRIEAQEKIPTAVRDGFPGLFNAKALVEEKADDDITKLKKARYNKLVEITRNYWVLYHRQRNDQEFVFVSSRRLLQAGLDVHQSAKDKLKFLREMTEFASKLEKIIRQRSMPDLAALDELYVLRLELEIERRIVENSKNTQDEQQTK